MRIAINAGHHPQLDSGAVGPNGTREADVNLAVADKVAQKLNAAEHEAFCYYADDLQEICDASNRFGADLFISIHCNGAAAPEAHGSETFYCDGSRRGQLLASFIQTNLCIMLNTADRGIKDNGLYVTRHTDAVAVLVELAFITNSSEETMLADPERQDAAADAIAQGVQEFVTSGVMG